jgi:hypothetical protein
MEVLLVEHNLAFLFSIRSIASSLESYRTVQRGPVLEMVWRCSHAILESTAY